MKPTRNDFARWFGICFGFAVVMLMIGSGCAAKNTGGPQYTVNIKGDVVPTGNTETLPAVEETLDESAGADKDAPRESSEAGETLAAGPTEKPSDDAEGVDNKAGRKPADSPGLAEDGQRIDIKQPVVSAASKPKDVPEGEPIVFNFENAAISDIIRNLAEQLDINYMFDVPVDGKVTIHTTGEFHEKDLWPLFFQILEANGLTAVKKGNIYHIVNRKDAARMPIISHTGGEGEGVMDDENMIIQIISLKYITAQEITKLLVPFISETGQIVSHDASNTLVVVDSAFNMPKVLKLVDAFDMNVFESQKHRFYPLNYVGVDEVVKTLNDIFSVYGSKGESSVSFIGLARLNTVLAIAPTEQGLDQAETFIMEMDVPSQGNEPKIYVYPVKNGQSAEISELLNKIFSRSSSEKSVQKEGTEQPDTYQKNPFAKERKTQARQKTDEKENNTQPEEKAGNQRPSVVPDVKAGTSDGNFSSGTLRGDIQITADETRNNIVIEAIPSDYRIIHNLLKQIDVLPRQVLIKMTIAEVTLDEQSELGIEWSYVKGDENLSTSLLNASLGAEGFKYTIGKMDRWTSALSMLASENKVNILSSPSILASNSKDAQIDVTTEVPVASSRYQYTSGDSPVVETDIEYRDTGVILSVTPHINEVGLVTMDLEQEISEQADSVQVGGQSFPAFFKRSAKTTLTVKSGQTIVIGGLIRETTSKGSTGAPWFYDIPVLNYLFGQKTDSLSKTELIIFISPSVIIDLEDVEAVTDEFKRKVRHIIPENL